MDTFTRRYILFLAVLTALIGIVWALQSDSRVNQLNAALLNNPTIANYPFPFRVLSLERGVATVSSPRSAEVSVLVFIGLAYPGLKGKDGDDPRVIAAEKQLAEVQGRVKKTLLAEPGVDSVQWKLGSEWFGHKGLYLR